MDRVYLNGVTSWTGALFLRAAAEFSRMTPDRKQWNEVALSSSPSRLVRYRRLAALAKGFDVQPSFTALFDGMFLIHRSAETFQAVKDRILRDVEENEPQLLDTLRADGWGGWPLPGAIVIYTGLSQLLIKAYAFRDSGVYLSSGLYTYPDLKANGWRNCYTSRSTALNRSSNYLSLQTAVLPTSANCPHWVGLRTISVQSTATPFDLRTIGPRDSGNAGAVFASTDGRPVPAIRKSVNPSVPNL
jgi:hypothetical protein